jgi:iron complex transport system substrate-binding protein
MIALCSAISQEHNPGCPHRQVRWEDVVAFNPDVIVVAPEGLDLKSSMASFKELSKLPHWEDLPAVKRSEVIFTDGIEHFYNPAVGIMDSMAILISAIAGFESGYITTRDTFYRLRWLELHRHRL